MVFQNSGEACDPVQNIGYHFWETMNCHGEKRSKKECYTYAAALLKQLRMPDPERILKSYPFELSGGMNQRVGIALAMVNNPQIILTDEPTSALDVSVQAQIIALLKRLQKEKNMAYLFITHDILLARNICDRIAVMYKGSIVETGMAAEILDNPGHPYTKLLLKCVLKPRIDKEFEFVDSDSLREASSEGCKFYEFCPYATEKCKLQRPELKEKKGRQIACFHEI